MVVDWNALSHEILEPKLGSSEANNIHEELRYKRDMTEIVFLESILLKYYTQMERQNRNFRILFLA